jgi:pimeloyl-ACP methyl ester carboxylesterase
MISILPKLTNSLFSDRLMEAEEVLMSLNSFQKPMQPWPGLEPFGCTIPLSRAQVTVFLYDAGSKDASPVILIHGLGDEADTWRYLLPDLSHNHRVIALDLPGFGRSGLPAQPLTIAFFREVILELMEVLGFPRATLIGHSMGAVIAHSLALEYPQRVHRLVLLAGSLVARFNRVNLATLLFLLPGLGEWQYNRLRKNPQAASRSLAAYYHSLESLPEPERAFLFQRVNERVWSDTQRTAFLSAFRNLARWLPAQQRALPARLSTFTIPTLVIWGEADRVVGLANGQALVELQPSARLKILPAAGHNLQQEAFREVLEAIEAG